MRQKIAMFIKTLGLLSLFVFALSSVALAGESADRTRQILESGQLAQGTREFGDKLTKAPLDSEIRFGTAMIRLARAMERYGQSQFQYGLRPPRNTFIPFLRFPVPENPKPEPLSYQEQRDVLKILLNDLLEVEATLVPLNDPLVKIRLDLNEIKFDFRKTGAVDESGKLVAILSALRMTQRPADKANEPFEIAFDQADALWLRGYCHLTAAMLEFLLAHDWHVTFEHSGNLFYPRIQPTPLGGIPEAAAATNAAGLPSRETGQIADLIAMIHEIRWPVSEPERMKSAHAHLKQVVALGRETWKAILAETDDDHEWIPSPRQKSGGFSIMPVTDEQVKGWLAALDDFEDLLDGKWLIPYWRFGQGINLKKVFFEPQGFDLILWLTGHAAVPFLENGKIMPTEIWTQRQRIFNGNFIGYAAWFN